jgi:hypothetical protein
MLMHYTLPIPHKINFSKTYCRGDQLSVVHGELMHRGVHQPRVTYLGVRNSYACDAS